jgi:chemotaxis response regulator CheB
LSSLLFLKDKNYGREATLSMQRSAIAAGCVDLVLSPERIAVEVARIARH